MLERTRIAPGPGQESVWDYPRPPILEPVEEDLRVVLDDITIGATNAGFRVLETSHPPVYYFPPGDVRVDLLRTDAGGTRCEFKGVAEYWSIVTEREQIKRAAWSYPNPTARFYPIQGYFAFYASRVDECWIGGERVAPQLGDFYGGWITSRVVGPFKGGPGTFGW